MLRTGRRDLGKFILDNFIWFINLAVFLLFAWRAQGFFTGLNMINLLMHASVLGLMVIGQTICLLSGNFDLSAEGTLSLVTTVAAWVMVPAGTLTRGIGWELNPLIVIPGIMLLGAAIGWFNGFMITRIGMNNFIVTLAMQLVLRGIAFTISQGFYMTNIPKLFNWLGTGRVGQIPVQILFTALAFVAFHYFLNNSRFGRQLYAVGGNRDAAHASGFKPARVITMAYMLSGFLAALAGWMLLGRIGQATTQLGAGLTLETVAASVIGGVALSGGFGSVGGALAGVLLLSIVDNGLNLMNVDPFWVGGIRGFIILIALMINAQKFRFRPKATITAAEASTSSLPESVKTL